MSAVEAPTPAPAPRSALRTVCARVAYWTPVLLALCLFAQVAFRGLRPAMAEGRRLAAADVVLQARYDRDVALYQTYDVQLRARRDPVFQERQRRMRRAVAPAAAPAQETPAQESPAPAGAALAAAGALPPGA